MKKFLLILTAVFGASLPTLQAQTGSTVREDRVWNYSIDGVNIDMETTSSTPDYGYHFKGLREADGISYAVLSDGGGKEVALMRQEGGRVYLHLDDKMKKLVESLEGTLDDFEEIFGGKSPTEMLLYDFDAKVGDSYYMPVFVHMDMEEENESGPYFVMTQFTVTDKRDVEICGDEMTVQTLSDDGYDYNVIEGVGPVQGMLHRPQFGWLNTGMNNTYSFLQSVCNSEGEAICEKNSDGLWPWEKTDYVAELTAASQLSYDGKRVSAEGEYLTIYTISGNQVAEGFGEVSTENLQPGVYVARSGTETLKILVR